MALCGSVPAWAAALAVHSGLPLAVQGRLLWVLEDGAVRRVGDTATRCAGVRAIFADVSPDFRPVSIGGLGLRRPSPHTVSCRG